MSQATGKVSRSAVVLALVVVLFSSLVRLPLAFLTQTGLYIAFGELVLNALFACALWKGKEWGRTGLILIAICNLIYFFGRAFFQLDIFLGLFECVTSFAILMLLVGHPSKVRAYGGVAIYTAAVLLFGNMIVLFVMQQTSGPKGRTIERYESPHGYTVAFKGSPWAVLSSDESAQALGVEIMEADLHVAKGDGSAFGLLFPLKFKNVPYSSKLGAELEGEIEERWLTDLTNWKQYPTEEGFLLTAKGRVDKTDLGYVIFYKHFGNLGVYAVFWTEASNQHQLLKDVRHMYGRVLAPPLKDRLQPHSPGQVYQENHDAVVMINVFDQDKKLVGRGSGFNISPDGLIVTNLHVMAQGDYLEVVFPKKETFRDVSIVGLSSQDVDLAMLSVPGSNLPTINGLKTMDVVPGDTVYVIGSPKGLVNTVSQGIVGGIREDQDITLYQITAPISNGSSGGPVFNQYGEVIGVANSVVKDAQNLNFSISIDELDHLLFLPRPVTLHYLMDYLREDQESGK